MTRISQVDAATGKSNGYIPWGFRSKLCQCLFAAYRTQVSVITMTEKILAAVKINHTPLMVSSIKM